MNKTSKKIIFSLLMISLLFNTFGVGLEVKEAKAAVNLIKGGSFEGDILAEWGLWKSEDSNREFQFYRAYDAPFGNGSYSAAIDAAGTPADAFSAILSSKQNVNSFTVDSSKKYFLLFHARATNPMDLISYLQKADDFSPASDIQAIKVGGSWNRYMVSVSPSTSGQAMLGFVFGDMPAGTTLYLDGVQLVEADMALITKSVAGSIGDKDKYLQISNLANFDEKSIEIELPFFDSSNSEEKGFTRINPDRMTTSGVYFKMPTGTYSGVGRVYASDIYVGQFNYNVAVKINDIHPSVVRLNEDLIVYGNGFSPLENATFLVAEKMIEFNKREKIWLAPLSFDSGLTQARFKLPAGVINGKFHIQSTYINTEGVEVINTSNQLSYKLKPIIVATNWSERGYEHVGDKLKIYGYGLGRNPVVNFYDSTGVILESPKATFIEVGEVELIEVATTKKSNNFSISIVSDGVSSDEADNLSYSAKPLLNSIKSKFSRKMFSSNETISAAKAGEVITLSGSSFKGNQGDSSVEFQGYNQRISVPVGSESINKTNNSLTVTVPNGALSGYIGVRVNGVDSNYLPLEIIPTIISVEPAVIVPGEEITIRAYGVGDSADLLKVNFSGSLENETSRPLSLVRDGEASIIKARAPFKLAAKSTMVGLQYDRWKDDGTTGLNVLPKIVRAGYNRDNKILSIVGQGFSISPTENVITYKYADENKTLITPKVRMLGVYPNDEGLEIRIQILDDYYYGRVSVKVGDLSSNEVSFGPITISNIAKRVEYNKASNATMGVLYISGYNFGSGGGVLVGEKWAEVHYRSDFFIIAVVPEENVYDGPVIVARE
jgi:hypothetical protein